MPILEFTWQAMGEIASLLSAARADLMTCLPRNLIGKLDRDRATYEAQGVCGLVLGPPKRKLLQNLRHHNR